MDRRSIRRHDSLPVQKCEGTVVVLPARLCICDAYIGGERHYLIWTEDSPDSYYAVKLEEAERDFDDKVRPYIDIPKNAKRNEREAAEDDLLNAVFDFLSRHPCSIENVLW